MRRWIMIAVASVTVTSRAGMSGDGYSGIGLQDQDQWIKEDLTQTCPDERTLLEMLQGIREDRTNKK